MKKRPGFGQCVGQVMQMAYVVEDNPSVYKQIIERNGYGFHHLGIAVEDVDAAISDDEGLGYELAFHAAVPTEGTVAFMDDAGQFQMRGPVKCAR